MTSVPAISFDYRPSRLVQAAAGAMVILTILVVALGGLPWFVRVLGLLAIVLYSRAGLRRLSRPALGSVFWHADGSWTIRARDAVEYEARLVRQRGFAGLIMLELAWATGREHLLIAPDNATPTLRRHLRMRLAAPVKGSG